MLKGNRKTLIGLCYLAGMVSIAAIEIYKHTPADLTGLGMFAGGVAVGVGTVMWGNAQEHKHANGEETK